MCGSIRLTMPLGSSYSAIESAFTSTIRGAASEFQDTFPDRLGLRTALVDQCVQLQDSFPGTVSICPVVSYYRIPSRASFSLAELITAC